MEHGDKFTSIIESTLCMVCGAETEFFHLCDEHMSPSTWGERFIYRQTGQEMEESAVSIAKFMGTTAQYALANYVTGVLDYSEDVRQLMFAIYDTIQGNFSGEDRCMADHDGPWWASVEALTAREKQLEMDDYRSTLCTNHQRDYSMLRVTRLEDSTLGVRHGTTLQKLLDTWAKTNATRARERLLASTQGKSVDEIVSQKIGANQ